MKPNRLIELGIIVAIIAVAATFRLWKIGSAPQTMNYDEALNGLIAVEILDGEYPPLIVYPGGREAMIFYLQAASVSILGRTPGALRLPTALASVGLVLGTLLTGRELFDRKIGLLMGLICASTLWPAYLGRLGTRSVLLPLVLAFALFATLRAWRTGRLLWWGVAGVLFGGAYYTYPPDLFVLPALLATVLGIALFDREALRVHKAGVMVVFGLTVLLALPIWVFRTTHVVQSFDRPSQLTVFYEGQGIKDLSWTVVTQTYLTLRMFVLKGDFNPRHNIPQRPAFDILMAVPFLIGLGVSWLRCYRRPALFCAGWAGIFLLPTFLSKDTPHFLRASGILPVLFIWPALGLHWGQQQLARWAGRLIGILVPVFLLAGSIFITTRDYLIADYLDSPALFMAFGGDDVALALEINRRIDVGWTGENLRAHPTPVATNQIVWIEPDLWDGDLYAQFLVPFAPGEQAYFRYLTPDSVPPNGVNDLIVSPEQTPYWLSRTPEGMQAIVYDGPWYTPPSESEPRVRFQILAWRPNPSP